MNTRIAVKLGGIFWILVFLIGTKSIPAAGKSNLIVDPFHPESISSISNGKGPITHCGFQPGESYQFGEVSFKVTDIQYSSPRFLLEWVDDIPDDERYLNYPVSVATYEEYVYVADVNNMQINKLRQDGTFLFKWGGIGTNPGQFYHPYGLTVDDNGDVYVVEFGGLGGHRLQKFDSDGNFLLQWGSPGLEDGDLQNPSAVEVVNGVVYVLEAGNHRLQTFSTEGEYLGKWGSFGSEDGQLSGPEGLAVDANGTIYIADTNNHRIQKFTYDGTFLLKWGERGENLGQFEYPWGLTLDSDGNLYVADSGNHRIQIFDPNGNLLLSWGSYGSEPGQFHFPKDVALDDQGDIYVADSYNHRIQKFAPVKACLSVKQFDRDHPRADPGTASGRYWKIKMKNARLMVGELTLPHDGLPNPQVCRWAHPGRGNPGSWDCDADASTASTVTRVGVSPSSDWTVGFGSNDQTPDPPEITGTNHGKFADLDGSVTFYGTAEPEHTVKIWLEQALLCSAQVPDSGAWNCMAQAPRQTGSFNAVATSTDQSGNTSEASHFTFIVPWLTYCPLTLK